MKERKTTQQPHDKRKQVCAEQHNKHMYKTRATHNQAMKPIQQYTTPTQLKTINTSSQQQQPMKATMSDARPTVKRTPMTDRRERRRRKRNDGVKPEDRRSTNTAAVKTATDDWNKQ